MKTKMIKCLLLLTISIGGLHHIPFKKGVSHLPDIVSLSDERDIGPMH
ncbi:hypothetical protein NQ095_18700 [Rossellomorea sp. SC111]|jgi:hypothetical protein|nr:hypothetical protein [Rossellomorea sp. SC111]MCR8850452.1 hypothetical protein [Rossellomorea sp. SC111]